MRVVLVTRFGGPEVLEMSERPIPEPGTGQVVVEVKAIGVNPVETYIRSGVYPVLPELPYIPGGNAAGRVHAVGAGVHRLTVGQRVYTSSGQGAYGEYSLCEEHQVYPLPEEVSFAQGAAIGVPAATAYRALFQRGLAKRGERVLVHGASGSVGTAAIQLGKAADLVMHGTAGTEKGAELVRSLGADLAIIHTGDYAEQLQRDIPGGYDLILEMLANKNLETDLELMAPRGRVVIIGSRGRIEIDPRATMGKETDIRGLALANATRDELSEAHAGLAEAMRSGVLRPVIATELPLAEAARAHEMVMEPGNCGKIILKPEKALFDR